MDLVNLSIVKFVEEVDSSTPAPGGGSVSSTVGAIGCALGRMVGHLSFGKKKYEANEDSIKEQFEACFNKIKIYQDRLLELIDEDTKSFGVFMDAMKLPKETDEEKQFRFNKMEEATKIIIKVPFEIAQVSLDALKNLETILYYGNKNAITDAGVSALLLCSGVEGATLNVKINLPGLSDEELVSKYIDECNKMVKEANLLKSKYISYVNENL